MDARGQTNTKTALDEWETRTHTDPPGWTNSTFLHKSNIYPTAREANVMQTCIKTQSFSSEDTRTSSQISSFCHLERLPKTFSTERRDVRTKESHPQKKRKTGCAIEHQQTNVFNRHDAEHLSIRLWFLEPEVCMTRTKTQLHKSTSS